MSQTSANHDSRWGPPRTRAGLIVFIAALVLLLTLGAPHGSGEHIAPAVVLVVGILLLAFVPRAIPPAEGSWARERLVSWSVAAAFYGELGVGTVGALSSLYTDSPLASIIAAGVVAVLGVILVLLVHGET